MRIEKCYFCSHPVYPGHGSMFVRNDCKIFKFCTSKCRKHFFHKKNPRRTRWTKSFRKLSGKELTVDPSFEFERRQHVPIKYNREKWATIVSGIKDVNDIKTRREAKFVMDRLRTDKVHALRSAKSTVRKHISVVRSPAAGLLKKSLAKINKEAESMEEEAGERLLERSSKRREAGLFADEESMVSIVKPKKNKKTLDTEEDEEEVMEDYVQQDDERRQRLLENDGDSNDDDDSNSNDDDSDEMETDDDE